MKILELTGFSAGIDGVWNRVKEEAVRLAEIGHNVMVFSSDIIKGSSEKALHEEQMGKVKIIRFHRRKLGGESYMEWDFEEEALKFRPDIIIAHGYRHTHTSKALKIGKKINAKILLVTHAPFVKKGETRTFLAKLVVRYYDNFIAPKIINKFDKIIAITKWEIPCLLRLGAKEDKIVYIPNGIPEEFFKLKKKKEENKILFFGRIAPIKNLETLIKAALLIKDKKIKLEIAGPSEESYIIKLKKLVKDLNADNRVIFTGPVYEAKEKINKIDSAKIFVLPSKREAMPQALIEAMAREKIVIASDNPGARDLIENGKNGFLFEYWNAKELAEKINYAADNYARLKKMKKEARKSVEQFSWDKIIAKINNLIENQQELNY